jgi:tetratricopeptide (TPR) repeat protein
VLERHGGTVEKYIGDAVMGIFGTPVMHEDDALRAVRAATEMREALAALNHELGRTWNIDLSVRTGVNTGEVVAGDGNRGQRLVTGSAVNLASRLEAAAVAGEILIGEATYRLVRNAVLVETVERLEIKGKAEPVRAWRVLGVITRAPAVARRLDSPLVDRERELPLLLQTLERTAAEQSCHLVTVLGPAGVGKSRLIQEVLRRADEQATVLVGRCLPYGDGITFWPVVEIVKRAAGLMAGLSTVESRARIANVLRGDPDAAVVADRLGGLLGLASEPRGTEEIFWAVRKLLEALARKRSVIVVFEDVHWGEETFLDLIEHIADWARDAPILVICLARAELIEERPSWAGGKLNATSLLLEPLDGESCAELIENLLDDAQIGEEVKRRILQAAEGNPLFIEEMLGMLIDDGLLRLEDGRWMADGDLSAIDVPPTIQALLDARLDRLGSDERTVLERASVAGRIFSHGAVKALTPPEEHVMLAELLQTLVRKQLIRPHRAEFGRDNTFRFRHILIRDASYRQMPKTSRAELHERFAGWLESGGGGRRGEQEEILGYHLEQAHRFLRELGGPDDAAITVGRRGADRLESAGRRAFTRGDMAGAAGLLTRAMLLLADDDEGWLGFASELGSALIETGQLERADGILSRAIDEAARVGNRRAHALAELERSVLRLHTNRAGTTDEVLERAQHALAVFEESGDDKGLAKAWKLVAQIHFIRCRFAEMEDVLERALKYARRAGDDREISIIHNALARASLFGPRPVQDALRVCAQIGEYAPADRPLEGAVSAIVGALNARVGRFDEARELARRSEEIFRDLGLSLFLAGLRQYTGGIELLAGDPGAAEREFRAGFDDYERMGERGRFSTTAALLAGALHELNRDEEAYSFTVASEESASTDDLASQVFWRSARAQILARRGDLDDAVRLAGEAVELAAQTDLLWMHGDALVALADVRRAAGSSDQAAEAAERALALYERKGDIVSSVKTAELLAELRSPELDPERPKR